MSIDLKTYESLAAESDCVEKIITPGMAEAVFSCNDHTTSVLQKKWSDNLRKNIGLYKKHGSFIDAFLGFGKNKAVIGVGAGPSFNKNKNVLKEIYEVNLLQKFEDQPFLIWASNKQLRPLLKMGVYPHFTLLIDAGDALLPQFKIPKWGRKDSILVAGLHTSPTILNHWDKQGGKICFYLIGEDDDKKFFEDETGEDASKLHIQQGGNVLNTMWILAQQVLWSTVFMAVGNDLSFPYTHDREAREKGFYADGDYRLNILNKRDEAKDNFAWMGFDLYESELMQGKYLYNLGVVGMSRQLWVYKVWLEIQAAIWAEKTNFFIYNCSEAGVSGVLAHSYDPKDILEKSNWFLIDEILPKRWLTTSLYKAARQFLEAKKCLTQTATGYAANGVVVLPGKTGFVKPIVLPKSA
jgi:hypothetical protein